jgi:hypothetical protein
MNSNLQYLSKLIQIIDTDGNDINKRKLWSLICLLAKKNVGEIPDLETFILVSEVHELNMEQYVRIQALNFYQGFPFGELRSELVNDFVEMEHCRRRDDFERFSMAAFQQIENITNYIFNHFSLFENANKDRDLPMLKGRTNRVGGPLGEQLVHYKIQDKKAAVEKLFKTPPDRVEFLPKFKMVLYYSYFNETVKSYDDWNAVFFMGYDLYLSRNQNHRGPNEKNKQIDKLESNKYRYYLLFLGFLADFIQKITAKYGVPEEATNMAEDIILES